MSKNWIVPLSLSLSLSLALAACGPELSSPDDAEPTSPASRTDQTEPSDGDETATTDDEDDSAPGSKDPGSKDPVDDPSEDPADPIDDPVDAPLIECVSDLVDSGGRHFAVVVNRGDDVTVVEVSSVTPDSDSQPQSARPPTEEVIWTEELEPTLDDGFFGFETADMWVTAEPTETPGIWRGRMQGESQFDDHVAVTCWTEELRRPAHYEDGTCVDESGEPARNELPFAYVHRTGFGQCTTLAGPLNGDALGYPVFGGLDLRGADLSAAELFFASFVDARLEGTDLSTFSFGYATVAGSTDAHTVLPEEGHCLGQESSEKDFRCTR